MSGLEAVSAIGSITGGAKTNAASQAWFAAQGTNTDLRVSDGGFGASLTGALANVEGLHRNSSNLLVKAATGRLEDVHDYTIAATQAKLATQLTVAIRNKAVEAFNQIMRMQA